MKKHLLSALALAMLLCLPCMGVSAEAKNYLKDQTWDKFLLPGTLTQKEENGEKYWSASGVKNAYGAPGVEVYDTIKEMKGSEEGVSVYIVFDARVKFAPDAGEDATFSFATLLRATKASSEAKNPDTFVDVYEGNNFRNGDGNVLFRLENQVELSEEWTRVETLAEFTEEDFQDSLWASSWTLCVDRMKGFENIQSVDFKNAGVYLADEYEPTEPEESDEPDEAGKLSATPTPVILNTPINFNKYGSTLSAERNSDNAVTEKETPAAQAEETATATVGQPEKEKNSNTGLIIAILGGAVGVAVIAAVVIIVIKRKQAAMMESNEEADEAPSEQDEQDK